MIDSERPPIVPALCANCLTPTSHYAEAEPDGYGGWKAPLARMYGSFYTHYVCPKTRERL